MGEFPDIARQRLGRVVAAGDHPDAGLLTAFVEGTLASTHRDFLLNHLVACSECNRLIALAAPEQQDAPVVAPVAVRRPWFAWAPLRWVGAAAAAAVVVSAVWIGQVNHTVNPPAAPSAALMKAPSLAVTAEVASPDRAARSARRENRQLAKAKPLPVQPQAPRIDPVIAAQSRPAAPGSVGDQSAFQTSMLSGENARTDISAATPEPLQPALQPEPAPSKPSAPIAPARAIGPVWSLSDAGVLRRSDDSGQSWSAVPVPSSVPMRAVFVMGHEIWIGGDRGTLLHSIDSGRTWITVVPSANGQMLSEDIARIAFSDIRHGWIATRQGRIWTTHDGGVNWVLK